MAQVAPGTPARSWGSRLAHALMMPAYWVERARGPKRLALLLIYALIALPIGVLAWRELRLFSIPNIGDPFDVKAMRKHRVADEDNAFVLYRRAAEQLQPMATAVGTLASAGVGRSSTPRAVRAPGRVASQPDWLGSNREALETWKRGTERPDALEVAPDEPRLGNPLMTVQLLLEFAKLASFEARRLRDAGDPAGALEMDLAILRSARHAAIAGSLNGRMMAIGIRSIAFNDLDAWATDPKADPALLRRALDEARKYRAARPPISDAFRQEYLGIMSTMDEAGFASEYGPWPDDSIIRAFPTAKVLYCWMLHEPERGRRLYRLWMANLLAYCDRAPDDRPSLVGQRYQTYGPEANAVPSAHRLAPEELEKQIEASPLARMYTPHLPMMIGYLDRERLQDDALVLTLAERLYAREQGHPPKVLGELLGRYLDALPEGNSPDDPAITSTETITEVDPR